MNFEFHTCSLLFVIHIFSFLYIYPLSNKCNICKLRLISIYFVDAIFMKGIKKSFIIICNLYYNFSKYNKVLGKEFHMKHKF